ncbi:pectate lyase [Saccharothrix saharensis]|uniref:Pectate lyase n=1 Tax=Saccharothrix saharensis TaxID=571190 RepID=A0A543JNZ4_9PSEU|nr:RICIN domain-containing protein [Saccharothrix saharensis]TQM84553.1 pectate lyase [Saccharothrix saharensis]
MNVEPPTTRAARPRRARWRAGAAAAAGVTALAATLVAWPVTTASAAIGAGTYTVKNVGSGHCLDVPNGTSTAGVQLQQASCGTAGSQQWTLTAVSGGYRISSVATGLCVGVQGASTSAGKAVQQVACTGGAGQTWTVTASGGNYRLVDTNSTKCMNIKDGSTAVGAGVQINSCDSVPTKQWTLTPANGVTTTTSTSTSTSTSTTTSTTTTTSTSNPPAGVATGYASQNGGTTGGQGGARVRATSGTQIHQALCSRASSSTPIIIEVEGTINHGNTAKVSGDSCSTAAGVIELKQISNVTIIGVGSGAVFDQLGIHIRESRNIIIRNVTIRNVKKSGSPTSNGGDAIGMESNVRNVWVDHTTLLASGGESEGYDGLFDMKDDTQYVTLSYSTLRNSGRGGLVGSSESDRSNGFVTYHHNLYENIDSRTPLLRGGIGHMYNNYYVNLNESGINSRAGARAKVDNNYFKNSKDVLGTFYTSEAGYWHVNGNIFDNITWSAPGTDTNPAGPDVTSTTIVSIPYGFRLDPANCVPAIIGQTAGANTGMKESNGSC